MKKLLKQYLDCAENKRPEMTGCGCFRESPTPNRDLGYWICEFCRFVEFIRAASMAYRTGKSPGYIRLLAGEIFELYLDDRMWSKLAAISPWSMDLEYASLARAMTGGGRMLWAKTFWFSNENLATACHRADRILSLAKSSGEEISPELVGLVGKDLAQELSDWVRGGDPT